MSWSPDPEAWRGRVAVVARATRPEQGVHAELDDAATRLRVGSRVGVRLAFRIASLG